MGVPSGNFQSQYAGMLEVTFSRLYQGYTGSPGGSSYLHLYCRIQDNTGATVADGVLLGQGRDNIDAASVTLLVEYPGGNVTYPISVTESSYAIGGAGYVQATHIKAACKLTKK